MELKTFPDIQAVGRQFQIAGRLVAAQPITHGHINDTYVVRYDGGGRETRYIHQRVNHHVFKDPLAVTENIRRVTTHIREKLLATGASDVERRVLTLVPTRANTFCHCTSEGDYWRTYQFVEGAHIHDIVETPAQAYQAAETFGEFQKLLTDLPGPRLAETIVDFHNTPKRFAAFQRAVAADGCNRAQLARPEIEFALRHQPITTVLTELERQGQIPERITHNDTKFNNVMLDDITHEGMCVVDLDTVMPGLALYDFGDMVRTATSETAEDERDLAKVRMEMPMFAALARGYLAAAGGFLNDAEKRQLPFAGKLITFETGLRFLTDYLLGDTYFKVHRAGHNLDRCRTQFKLVASIAQQEEEMTRLVGGLA